MTGFTQVARSLRSPNRLLARLTHEGYRRLLPHLAPVRLEPKHVLLGPRMLSDKVHFLGCGVCSIVHSTAEGQSVGVAIVGNEGLIGVGAFGGDPESGETATIALVDATAETMDAAVFDREMAAGGELSHVVHRYAQAFAEALMQSVACNALHSIEQRVARCLLDISDRVGADELPLTQETLAALLGVRRASITLAARALQRAGLVDHGHKHIVIRDLPGLQNASCECYRTIKRYFARLLP